MTLRSLSSFRSLCPSASRDLKDGKDRKDLERITSEPTLARSALRASSAVAKTRVHRCCSPDAGAWDRRQHSNLYSSELGTVAPVAVSRPRPARACERKPAEARLEHDVGLSGGGSRLSEREGSLFPHRGLHRSGFYLNRQRRSAANPGRASFNQPFPGSSISTAGRTIL